MARTSQSQRGEHGDDHQGDRGRYGRRRPRPGLTPAKIVAAGQAVIVRDGLDALTMRSVAAELGTAATSLYRHVRHREALLIAILEQVATGLPVEVPGRDPVTRLQRRFVDAHDYMAEHIWVVHVLIRGELVAENAFPFAEACLSDFLAAGLTTTQALRAYRACWHLTIGELLDTHPLHPPQRPTQRDRAIEQADPQRFPAIATTRALPDTIRTHDDFRVAIRCLLEALVGAAAVTA